MPRTWKTWLMMGLLAASVGCQQRYRARTAAVVAAPCPPTGRVLLPAPPGVVGGPPAGAIGGPPPGAGFTLPPGAVYTPPGGAPVIRPTEPPPGSTRAIPGVPPIAATPIPPSAPAQVDYRWTPAPDQAAPVTKAPFGKKPAPVLLYPPEITEEPPLDTSKSAPRKSATSLPVGIPSFAAARDNVATGLRPSLDEGLDWLAANEYKTVLHLHPPAEADNADRKQVEKRGLKYISLPLDPQGLTREGADEFLRIVKDAAGHPLFVYDRDGSLAGPLWYLYFRVAEELPEDAARVRAGRLGLREEGPLWEAVRQFAK